MAAATKKPAKAAKRKKAAPVVVAETPKAEVVLAYKGFDKNLVCNPGGKPFQYEFGKTYTNAGPVVRCAAGGFHSCEMPIGHRPLYLSPIACGSIALNVAHHRCHEAADAFWKYWRENGETHKHGYYESTWGAINSALRLVGVVPFEYHAAPPPDRLAELLREIETLVARLDRKDCDIVPQDDGEQGWHDAHNMIADDLRAILAKYKGA